MTTEDTKGALPKDFDPGRSILGILATLPSGAAGVALGVDEFAAHCRESIGGQPEIERNARHRLRDEIYRDGGVGYVTQVVATLFDHPKVQELRQKLAPYARFNNACKRIVREKSSLYQEPAKRFVGGSAENEAKYQEVLRIVRVDECTPETNRLYNLHGHIHFVGVRVRDYPGVKKEPVLDMWTAANVRVLTHPGDSTLVIGYLLRVGSQHVREKADRPAWVLWTDYERAFLTEEFVAVPGTWKVHGFVDSAGNPVCPVIPISAYPHPPGFWPGEEGEDLVAGTIAIWITNLLLLKETKSNTKQPVISGDATEMEREQAHDSDVPLVAPDGVSVSTLDKITDPGLFTAPVDHILEGLGNNHGLSMTLLKHQGIQSADARDAMRIPLRELRREQQTPFRRFEQQLAIVLSAVLKVDMPELAFDVVDFRVDFGEAQTPRTEAEDIDLHLKLRGAGLDNPIAFLQRKSPDTSETAAREKVITNIVVMTWLVGLMREMSAMQGGTREEVEDPARDDAEEGGGEETNSQEGKAA